MEPTESGERKNGGRRGKKAPRPDPSVYGPASIPTQPGMRDESGRLCQALLEHLEEGIILLAPDDGILHANGYAFRLLRAPAFKPGQPFALFLAEAEAISSEAKAHLLAELARLSRGISAPLFSAGGLAFRLFSLPDNHRGLLFFSESRLAAIAAIDPVTGLPNRRTFQLALQRAFTDQAGSAALLILDIDRFKTINDSLGHAIGDALLGLVAQRLRGGLRPADHLARLGGDEFAVLLRPAEAGAVLAERLLGLLAEPYLVKGHAVTAGVSIGLAVAPEDADTPDLLLKRAELALYAAKEEGRGRLRRFDPEMDKRAEARLALETDLRQALAFGQFELHYQPLLDLETRSLAGFEALLRWPHPSRGMVSPAEFIPLAEEIGLIVPLGEWVLREACRTARTWPRDLSVAVNVSARQFADGPRLVRAVRHALTEAELPGERLEIEITESVFLANAPDTLSTLHQLRALGIRIAMDDFGTGYSSLSQLRSFPFDKIKIDRFFLSRLESGEGDNLAVVRAIASLGRTLGMVVTAEGVETERQAELVRESGGHQIQGYWISRPLPASALPALFQKLPLESPPLRSSPAQPHSAS
jgi:diguanylate cyclase (GGDEF)-like protein